MISSDKNIIRIGSVRFESINLRDVSGQAFVATVNADGPYARTQAHNTRREREYAEELRSRAAEKLSALVGEAVTVIEWATV